MDVPPSQESYVDNAHGFICPINFLLEILSAKWTVEILRELFIRPTRTRRFLALVPGLNMKTLMERLKSLESQGLIVRTVYPELPLRVEYSLTPKGRELYQVLVALKLLGSRWLGTACACSCEGTAADIACPRRPPERK